MAKHTFVGDVDVTGQITSPTVDAAFYNLGAFDAVVDNGDGTVTITRQTGYRTFDGTEDWHALDTHSTYFNTYTPFANDYMRVAGTEKPLFILNYKGYVTVPQNSWGNAGGTATADAVGASGSNIGVAFFNSMLSSVSLEELYRYLKAHPLVVQYKLTSAKTETVIANREAYYKEYPNRALYNLGSFDSYLENPDGTVTITRRTGRVSVNGSEAWGKYFGETKYYIPVGEAEVPDYSPEVVIASNGYVYDNAWDGNKNFSYANLTSVLAGAKGFFFRNDDIASLDDWKAYVAQNPFVIEYRRNTITTETIIKDRPISQLDARGEEWVKSEYEKTINLMPQSEIVVVANGAAFVNKATQAVFVEIGKTYTVSFNAQVTNASMCPYVAVYCNGTHFNKAGEYNTNKQTLAFTFTATNQKFYLLIYATIGTKLTNTTTLSDIILAESPAPVPFVPYDASGHITHPEAKLLLNEYQKSANLFHVDTNAIPLVTINNGTSVYFNYPGERSVYVAIKPNTTYTFSADKVVRISQCASVPANGLSTTSGKGVDVTANTSVTFTTAADSQYFVVSTSVLTWNEVKITLVEGTEPLPYQEYHGKIVHEGDAGVLLWQNASPNDAFAAQTINVADMSKYKYIVFAFKSYKSAPFSLVYQKIKYDLSATGGTTLFLNDWNGEVTMIYPKCRIVKLASSTSVTFSIGYEKSTNQDANQVVPVAIYGTNIL